MIGFTKDQKNSWDSFVLSCEQGKQPCVQSEERRQGILAVSRFVKKYFPIDGHLNFSHECIGDICLTTDGQLLTSSSQKKGYVATIMATVQLADDIAPHVLQDLHLTEKQLKYLKYQIDGFLQG